MKAALVAVVAALVAPMAAPMATTAPVEVRAISLQELVALSPVIVVGDVRSVSESADHQVVATIVPTETWRGEVQHSITFNATSTWACDISKARLGEHLVLFLAPDKNGSLRIAHHGRGRMPFRYADDKAYVTSSDDFGIDPALRYDFRNWDPFRYGVEFAEFKRLVADAVRALTAGPAGSAVLDGLSGTDACLGCRLQQEVRLGSTRVVLSESASNCSRWVARQFPCHEHHWTHIGCWYDDHSTACFRNTWLIRLPADDWLAYLQSLPEAQCEEVVSTAAASTDSAAKLIRDCEAWIKQRDASR